jgi:hypothetical protein
LSTYDEKNWIEGDFFRLLCLHKYGGFYFDQDMIILRDLSPLNNIQFLYQWGSSGTTSKEKNIVFNGAAMRMDALSKVSCELLLETTKISPGGTNWSSVIYSKVIDRDLYHLPCAWFNTEWCLKDPNYVFDPFKKRGRTDVFDGAFSWHWHNKWNEDVEEGSKFQILEDLINKKFELIKNKYQI